MSNEVKKRSLFLPSFRVTTYRAQVTGDTSQVMKFSSITTETNGSHTMLKTVADWDLL